MKNSSFFYVLALLLGLTGTLFWMNQTNICTQKAIHPTQRILIGSTAVDVAVAQTPTEQEHGLSDVCNLATDTGMLFIFPEASQPTFWMKDMKIPLDLIWIANHTVVAINQNVPADDGKILYPAPQTIDAVLEVPAGFSQNHGLTLETKVSDMVAL